MRPAWLICPRVVPSRVSLRVTESRRISLIMMSKVGPGSQCIFCISHFCSDILHILHILVHICWISHFPTAIDLTFLHILVHFLHIFTIFFCKFFTHFNAYFFAYSAYFTYYSAYFLHILQHIYSIFAAYYFACFANVHHDILQIFCIFIYLFSIFICKFVAYFAYTYFAYVLHIFLHIQHILFHCVTTSGNWLESCQCTPGIWWYKTVCTYMRREPYWRHGDTRNLKMVHTGTYCHPASNS